MQQEGKRDNCSNRQRSECDSVRERTLGRPASDLNCRSIGDESQPTVGEHHRLNGLKSLRIALAHVLLGNGTYSYKCLYSATKASDRVLTPVSALCPVLAQEPKRQSQETENRAALYCCQPDSETTGLKFALKRSPLQHTPSTAFIHIVAIVHAVCSHGACRYKLR